MNLYEIKNEILNCVDMETGEIVDIKKLESLQMERDQKIENIGCWIKNLLSDAEALKSEKENLAKRQKVAESKATSLKEYLSRYLDGEKFKSARVAISFRSVAPWILRKVQLSQKNILSIQSLNRTRSD